MKRAVVLWASAYGVERIWFATGHAPVWKLPGDDLLIPNWLSVVGCVLTALAMTTIRPRILWALAVGWVLSAAFILLDLVAAVLPGLGIPFDPLGMLSRVGAITGATLLGLVAKAHQPASKPWPRWVSAAGASLAFAGCLTRLVAQAVVGFDRSPFGGHLSLIAFEGGFVLAGTVLPFLLVHPIGLWFPRWMLLLPGFTIGFGMSAYFGVGLVQMVVAVAQGQPVAGEGSGLPDSFFWVAIPAYLTWGAGLVAAARGYQFATRKGARPEYDPSNQGRAA
ncbi:hypothetical protein ABZX12_26305 [Kribbella sp. NPDC003505]|uniref:hypothetical protein n=1 Tax=Kribbella sp. NPDC003505 TaxID=3154448 RepID=UPI00339FB65B